MNEIRLPRCREDVSIEIIDNVVHSRGPLGFFLFRESIRVKTTFINFGENDWQHCGPSMLVLFCKLVFFNFYRLWCLAMWSINPFLDLHVLSQKLQGMERPSI